MERTRKKRLKAKTIAQLYDSLCDRERRSAAKEQAADRTLSMNPPHEAPRIQKPPKRVKVQGFIACPDCTGHFADLRTHLVAVHGWLRQSDAGPIAPPTERKRLVRCPCCKETSVRRDRLDQHLQKQHGLNQRLVSADRKPRNKARRAEPTRAELLFVPHSAPGKSDTKTHSPGTTRGQKRKGRNSDTKGRTGSDRRVNSGAKTFFSPFYQESANPLRQERYERMSDATRGLGYARREGAHWGSTVAFDDYSDESHA